MEAIRRFELPCKMQIACSGEEYDYVAPQEVPIKETNPLRPLSPYTDSKVAQEYLSYQYFKRYGLHIILTLTFNHTNRRALSFANGKRAVFFLPYHFVY